MTNRERFLNVMNFKSADRLPIWELAVWWDKTIERWKREGLPEYLEDESDIRDYFGLDRHRRFRIRPQKPTYPELEYGKGLVSDEDSYGRIKEHLFPEEPFDSEKIENWSTQQSEGNAVVWLMLDGFAPLEIQAGNDLLKLRKNYPGIKVIGGYDKMVMSKGENEMRAEFERILPVMKQGGYIPSTDHQVPPEVSLANYKIYLKLLKEYCNRG